MHIPDGFLSTPVWLGLDVAAAAAVGLVARRAERGMAQDMAPRLGVLGAFIFAAQMINFPVAAGTSSHLIGGALLTAAVGPVGASLVLTAILAIQALVFQDGGLLALGANIINMAVVGVLAAAIPLRYFPGRAGLFAAGASSVFAASSLSITELRLSGVPVSAGILQAALVVFLLSAMMEGLITVAVMGAIQRIHPEWAGAKRAAGKERRVLGAVGVASVVLVSAGALLASSLPDGLETLAAKLGIDGRAYSVLASPFADYEWSAMPTHALGKVAAGLCGLGLVYMSCRFAGKLASRRTGGNGR